MVKTNDYQFGSSFVSLHHEDVYGLFDNTVDNIVNVVQSF